MQKEAAKLDIYLKMPICMHLCMCTHTGIYIHTHSKLVRALSRTPSQGSGWKQWHYQHSMHNHAAQLFSTAKVLRALPP